MQVSMLGEDLGPENHPKNLVMIKDLCIPAQGDPENYFSTLRQLAHVGEVE
jgi:hypothetical protein